jgi:hypothetical protein
MLCLLWRCQSRIADVTGGWQYEWLFNADKSLCVKLPDRMAELSGSA